MRLIERYFFGQMRASALLAAAALTGIALLSQSLSALDLITDQHQSPWVFVKVILLATPQLLGLVLPIAVLLATLAVAARLESDREFVICQSAGMGRWRMLAPFLRLSGWAALAILLLGLWAQPFCYRILRQTVVTARADLAGALIRPGQFSHPAPGLTVFAQSLDDDGVFHNIFIHQETGRGRDNTLTARSGQVRRRGGLPVLVLRDGANQSFDPKGKTDLLAFDEYVLDFHSLLGRAIELEYKPSDRYLHELFFPPAEARWAGSHWRVLLAEAHARLAAPLYAVAFAIIGLAGIVGAEGYAPRGVARPAIAAGAALFDRTLGFAAEAAAGADARLNLLQYAAPLLAIAAGAWLLARRRRPRPLRLTLPRVAAAASRLA